MRIRRILFMRYRQKRFDDIGVRVFLPSLMTFLLARRSSQCALYYCSMHFAVSCQQYLEDSYQTSGVYRLFVVGPCKRPVKTICDQSKLYGGGWTLLVI